MSILNRLASARNRAVHARGVSGIAQHSQSSRDSVRSFNRQFEHLKATGKESPNQLKWKQLLNALLGSPRSDVSALAHMSFDEILPVISHIATLPCQGRRHEVFSSCSERIMLIRAATGVLDTAASIQVVRAVLDASLDLVDAETRRFRSRQVREAIAASTQVLQTLVTDILSDDTSKLTRHDSVRLVYSLAFAHDRGILPATRDGRLRGFADQAIEWCMSVQPGLGVPTKAETVWAIGTFVSAGVVSGDVRDRVRRIVTAQDLMGFQIGRNFSNVSIADPATFVALLQLQSGFRKLGLDSSALFSLIGDTLSDASTNPQCQNGTVAAQCIWWSARVADPASPLLADWTRTCMNRVDSLSENERWIASTGLHELLKRNDSLEALSEESIRQLNYCVSNDVLNRPQRAAVAWRSGGDKQFIR